MDDHIDPEHLSRLSQELAAERAKLPDRRRKYKVPDGMVIGSAEYKIWMAEQVQLRQRLYQKKAYLNRRKISLALQKYTENDQQTAEAAIAEVDTQLAALRELKPVDVSDVKRGRPSKTSEHYTKEVEDRRNPWIVEHAEKYGVSYEEAERIMNSPDYKDGTSFEQYINKMAKGLEAIIGKPLGDL